ncbi:MAG TPA: carbohydrate-binding family 9-like protein, partial [Mucilaginibacter sp.]|nr:carbohydrate-binding family 9-like protein [Mucilaginibacter sp.]
ILILLFTLSTRGQSTFKGLEPLFTTPEHYIVYHTDNPPVIDGNITDLVWQQVSWTNEFQDIEGTAKPHPAFPTKVKMLWDDSCLYIAAQITESQVWATLKNHDDVVFHDNDFEVFIDPYNTTQPYFEIEVNALNTIFDLLLNKPYRDEGEPLISWDVKGLRSAVKIRGTLNNPSDKDEGWTVEMAIPFKSISLGSLNQVPKEGALWRINFSRVEWDAKVIDGKYVKLTQPEHNWVWSPQGVVNMHYPERWGYLQFSRQTINSVTFNLPYAELQKQYLWLIYYRQRQWFKVHQAYALSLHDLGINESVIIGKKNNTLTLEATKHQFTAWVTDSESKLTCAINQEGLIQQSNMPTNE